MTARSSMPLPVLLSPLLLTLLLLPSGCAPAAPAVSDKPSPLVVQLTSGSDVQRADAAAALATSGDLTAVEPLIDRLRHDPVHDVRIASARALGILRDRRATPPLLEALADPILADLRVAAANALGILADPQAAGPLAQATADDDLAVRREAVLALGKIGPPAIAALTSRLRAGQPFAREQAAEALGATGSPDALPHLLAQLGDERRDVRVALARALAAIARAAADSPAVKALPGNLAALLADPSWTARHGALLTLIEWPGALPTKAIVPLLDDPQPEVRTAAGNALQRLGRTAIDPCLQQLADKDPAARQQAARLLGHMRDTRAVESLVTALADADPGVRAAATEALGRIGEPESSPKLVDMLADAAPAVRAAARVAVRQNAPHIFPKILAGVSDERQPVRVGCVHVLRELNDRRGLDALVQAADDGDEEVRLAAVQALGSIGVYSIPIESAILRRLDSAKLDTPRIRKAAAEALERVRANK